MLGWEWDLSKIKNQGITENVVELMTEKILIFDCKIQNTLSLAALPGRFGIRITILLFLKGRSMISQIKKKKNRQIENEKSLKPLTKKLWKVFDTPK